MSSNHLSVCGINIKVTVLEMTLKVHKELKRVCVRGQVSKDAPALYTRTGTYPAAEDNCSAENKYCSE